VGSLSIPVASVSLQQVEPNSFLAQFLPLRVRGSLRIAVVKGLSVGLGNLYLPAHTLWAWGLP
jgi:hypothetical protein